MLGIAILAGGQSRRMGTDKAALRWKQSTLLERSAHLARSIADDVSVIGREEPLNWPQELSCVHFVPDETPHAGPLGGLQSALKNLPLTHQKVLCLACDLPLLDERALRWLIERDAQSRNHHGVIVDNAGQLEPLVAIYHRDVMPLIDAQMQSGRRSLHALIQSGDFALASAPDWLQPQLANFNTPEDWHSLVGRRE